MATVYLVSIRRNSTEADPAYTEEPHLFNQGLRVAFTVHAQAQSYAGMAISRQLQSDRTKTAWKGSVEEFQIQDAPQPELELRLNGVIQFMELALIQGHSFRAIFDQAEKDMAAALMAAKGEKPRPRI